MTHTRIAAVAVVLILGIGVGGYVAYDQVLRGDTIAPLALPSSPPATGAATASTDPVASPDPGGSADPSVSVDDDVAGTWTVTGGSQAGYRVREQLAQLPAESDAVGRTDQVSGSITITSDGTTSSLVAGTLQVDTTAISSDKPQRDNRLRTEGLQTDTYPTASFALTQPVAIPTAAISGASADITLVGDLTIHGVTKSVQIPSQALLLDGTIKVAGSISFPLSDYGMVAPNIGGFIVSIADHGTLEFLVVFARA
jgi:polyisoprenoid-binding protein YceI